MAEPGLVSAATLGAVTRLVGDLARLGFDAWRKNRAARDKLVALLFHVQGEVDNNRRSVRAALNGSSVEWLSTAVYDVAIEALVPALVNDKSASILDPLQQARGLITWGLQERMRQFAVGEGDGVELKQLSVFFSSASYEIDRWFEAQKIGRRGIALHDCEARTERELVGGFERVEQSVILTTWRTFRNALLRGEAHEYTLRDEIGLPSVYVDPDPLHEVVLREDGQHLYPSLHSFELIEGIFEVMVELALRLLYCQIEGWPILLDVVRLADDEEDEWAPKDYAVRAQCRAESWRRQRH